MCTISTDAGQARCSLRCRILVPRQRLHYGQTDLHDICFNKMTDSIGKKLLRQLSERKTMQ